MSDKYGYHRDAYNDKKQPSVDRHREVGQQGHADYHNIKQIRSKETLPKEKDRFIPKYTLDIQSRKRRSTEKVGTNRHAMIEATTRAHERERPEKHSRNKSERARKERHDSYYNID